MQATILHVEDDPGLAEIVRLTFEDFGFRGSMLTAASIAEGIRLLEELARTQRPLDLLLTDMALPDGTGFEVVRRARQLPPFAATPIVILSGDADPRRVGCAYALGASSWISKSPRDRRLIDVMRTLYDHWLVDAVRPEQETERGRRYLAIAAKLRGRNADLFIGLANRIPDRPYDVAFLLTRALGEANLANLLKFVDLQIADREVPSELLDKIERAQLDAEATLTAVEREILASPTTTSAEVYRWILRLAGILLHPAYESGLAMAQRLAPRAGAALEDFLAAYLDDLVAWLEVHTDDPTLRRELPPLRRSAARMRALHDREAQVAAAT